MVSETVMELQNAANSLHTHIECVLGNIDSPFLFLAFCDAYLKRVEELTALPTVRVSLHACAQAHSAVTDLIILNAPTDTIRDAIQMLDMRIALNGNTDE